MRNIRVAPRSEWVALQPPAPRPPSRRASAVRDWLATLPVLLLVPALVLPLFATSAARGPALSASPASADQGTTVTVSGSGFPKGSQGALVWSLDGRTIGTFRANGGVFKVRPLLPADLATGHGALEARSAGGALISSGSLTVTAPAAAPEPTPSPTPSPLPSPTPVPTASPTPSPTPVPTASPTPTATPAPTATPVPSASATPAPPATSLPGPAFYVSTTGSDANSGSISAPWRTLQRAADLVQPGAYVYARGGTYSGFAVSRSGTSTAPITFTAYPGEIVTVVGDSSRPNVIRVNGAHDIVVKGFVVTGAPSQWGSGIRTENGAYRVVIEDNDIHDNRSFGIKLQGSTAVTVRANDIYKNETGIEVSGAGEGHILTGNWIHDNDRMVVNTVGGNEDRGANAFVFYKTTGSITVSRNSIWNNRATSYDYGYDGGAFEIYAASNLTIVENRMWNNENVVETGTDGTAGCNDNKFIRNVAYGGAKTGPTMGLILRCAARMLVANNTTYDLDRFVYDVNANASAFGGSIDGLRIVNNVAVQRTDKVHSIDSALPSSVIIDRNVIFHTGGGSIAYVAGKGNTSSLATFRTWTLREGAGMQADPRMVAPASGDFRLLSTSPAIDQGLWIAGVTDGYVGAAPDLGRYEFGQ